MKITRVICAGGRTGFFFDDQKAIKAGAIADGATYQGTPQTPGFSAVRQAGEAISVLLVLENGEIGWGDCAAVQYSGAGGRDPLFLAEEFIPVIQEHVAPAFIGEEADRGRGYGAEAIRLILDYGFNTLNLHNIQLHLNGDNAQALACYKKVGFKEFGRRRESKFHSGRYVDQIYMDILDSEFLAQ